MTTELDNTRHVLRHVVTDGQPPNGTAPSDCGPFAETVELIYAAYDKGGTPAVRRVWASVVRANPKLGDLISEDKPEPAQPAQSSGWGAILPFRNFDLPEFPLDVLPPWLRDYCQAVTNTMQTPPDLAGMLALSVVSTACARRVMVKAWDGWVEPVNVYTVTSLPPGSRKSPVFRAMMGPINMFERKLLEKSGDEITRAETEREILKSKLEEAKRKASKMQGSEYSLKMAWSEVDGIAGELKDLVIPVPPKLIVDDVTPEPLASILAEQGRIAVLSSEGDIFAIMAGRYSSGAPNIGIYKKGHAGEDVRVERRNRSEHVKNACITIGITTQPEVLRSFGQNAAFRSEGLVARFFYALPISTVGNREPVTDPIPDQVRSRYYANLLDLLEDLYSGNSGNCGNKSNSDSGNTDKNLYIDDFQDISILEISQEARDRLIGFLAWLEPQLGPYGALAPIVDWASKLGGGILRVAGLLHMADQTSHNSHNSQNVISDATLARAIRLAQYLIPHAQAAYAEIGTDPAVESAKLILRWMGKTGARAFTKRECYQGVKGTFKRASDLDSVLELLVDHGYLREVEMAERAGPGRKPSQAYEVNPIFFDGSHNSHNPQNTGASYEPIAPVEYEQPTYRSIEGYD